MTTRDKRNTLARLATGATVVLFVFLLASSIQTTRRAIDQLHETSAELRAAQDERDAAKGQIKDLQGRIDDLTVTVRALTRQLRDAGITPETPTPTATPGVARPGRVDGPRATNGTVRAASPARTSPEAHRPARGVEPATGGGSRAKTPAAPRAPGPEPSTSTPPAADRPSLLDACVADGLLCVDGTLR